MPDRRGSRFVLEVLFLLALAGALTLANLRPLEIAGIMLVGWLIVAALEWAAWRDEPHYGSGLPPRYYVPQINLPPAQPLEAVSAGYPEARDEAPTWIASASLRAEMLGEWPVAAPPVSQPDETQAGPTQAEPEERSPEERSPEEAVDPDPWTHAEELPVAPLGELQPLGELEPLGDLGPEPLPEAEPVLEVPPVSPPAPPPAAVVPEAKAEPEHVAAVAPPEPEVAAEPSLDVVLARSAQGVARYSLDPLGDPQPRRRFSRGAAPEPDAVEVPARPEGVRALPGRTNRQD
jgi:hypothetical protein